MRLKRRVLYFVGILLCVVLALFLIVKGSTIISSGGSLSSPKTSEMTSVSGEQSQPTVTSAESLEDPPETTQSLQIEEIAVPEHKPVYNYTEEELDLLARLIYSEGGIESYDTQLKIGSVVMNRVDDPYFPNTIREVIYQENQLLYVNKGTTKIRFRYAYLKEGFKDILQELLEAEMDATLGYEKYQNVF